MKRWQTFAITWALLQVALAIRSLKPDAGDLYHWSSIATSLVCTALMYAAIITYKDTK